VTEKDTDMRLIDRSEILPFGEYETIRPHFRARVIDEKKKRRVSVGEHMYAVFENRDSALLQIQEMLRTERISAEPAIAHEIETYNDLVPGGGQLSLTLFVAIPERETRDRVLVELAGLENEVGLEVDGVFFPAVPKVGPGAIPERTTAVHYFKVTPSAEAAASLRAKTAKAALVVKHPRYAERAPLSKETLAGLAEDLG
jgi:hypothetical protein